jgi:hypothetical protein
MSINTLFREDWPTSTKSGAFRPVARRLAGLPDLLFFSAL